MNTFPMPSSPLTECRFEPGFRHDRHSSTSRTSAFSARVSSPSLLNGKCRHNLLRVPDDLGEPYYPTPEAPVHPQAVGMVAERIKLRYQPVPCARHIRLHYQG